MSFFPVASELQPVLARNDLPPFAHCSQQWYSFSTGSGQVPEPVLKFPQISDFLIMSFIPPKFLHSQLTQSAMQQIAFFKFSIISSTSAVNKTPFHAFL